ncbi:MAG: hypothetical protein Q4A93_03140 [Actinomycetota bacterium]|nr:hypothetical protein [Actinomycetota bacterium]
MLSKKHKIELDESIIEEFDKAVNEQKHISMQKHFSSKKYGGLCAWDCICVCIHRIRDTVGYLNDMELGSMSHGNAFDFMEFVNCSAIVIDSVSMLAEIFCVDLIEEDARTAVFSQLGADGEGTDKKYFEFLRSLCVVHPMKTNRHGRYQGSDLVSCAFITWSNETIRMAFNDCDLHANAFVNDANSWGDSVEIYIDQVFSYVEYRYGLLSKVKSGLVRYQQATIEAFKARPVLPKGAEESDGAYLVRLKCEEHDRFGNGNAFAFDFAREILAFEPTNPANHLLVERFKNAWRFAIELERSALCNMTHCGCENAGIDDDTGWTLFENLDECYVHHPDLKVFDYHLEKLHYLDGTHSENDAMWGRLKFDEMRHVFETRAVLDDCIGDHELYLLACAVLYEMALEVPGPINDAIPQSPEFRKGIDNRESRVIVDD